jgi:hypothetical protein
MKNTKETKCWVGKTYAMFPDNTQKEYYFSYDHWCDTLGNYEGFDALGCIEREHKKPVYATVFETYLLVTTVEKLDDSEETMITTVRKTNRNISVDLEKRILTREDVDKILKEKKVD